MSFMKLTKLTGPDRNWRLIRTVIICFGYFCCGWEMGTTGPALFDFKVLNRTTVEKAAYIIIGRAIGIALGSIISGPIIGKLDKQLSIGLSLILCALLETAIPFFGAIEFTIAVFVLIGLSLGFFKSAVTAYVAYLWGSECEPFMQSLQFSFGFGASVAPIFASYYLLPITDNNTDNFKPEDVKIQKCYYMVGALCFITALVILAIYKFFEPSTEHPDRLTQSDSNQEDNDQPRSLKICNIVIVSLASLLMFFIYGIEISFGSYLTTYAVKCPLKLSTGVGALMSAVYWITFTFTRLIAIFYIRFIGSGNNLILCVALMLLSNVFFFPFDNIEWCLWAGTAMIGIGSSSIWGSVFGYLEKIINLSSSMIGGIITMGCIGECIIPILVAYQIENNPDIFRWLTLGCTSALVIILVIVIPLGFIIQKKNQAR